MILFYTRRLSYCIGEMSYYAVAKGIKPGIYRTWQECEKQIKNYSGAKFRKFSTETEAANFIIEFGTSTSGQKKEPKLLHAGSVSTQFLISPVKMSNEKSLPDSNIFVPTTNTSSPKLKVESLKQRLLLLEQKYEESMVQLRLEIDTVKERIDTFDNRISVPSVKQAETNDIKLLRECLSALAKHYTDSVKEIRAELDSLTQAVKSLESEKGQSEIKIKKEVITGNSSLTYKRNLTSILEAVQPTTTSERSYSSRAEGKSNKRKRALATYEEGPSKTVKVEPRDIDDEKDSETNAFSNFETDDSGYVHVYTDGACVKNGKVGAKAGVGVWFADNHPLNYSEPVRGRPTNNTAEIQAATCAIDLAKRAGITNLVIHTDSQFLINCITIWIHKWKKNGWQLSEGGYVKNKEDLIALDEALKEMNVRWNHVRGHKGNHGNEMADALARAGARKRY